MRVLDWYGFAETGCAEETAMTIGVFDGVHRGHQLLIERILRRGPAPAVVTFRQNPRRVLGGALAGPAGDASAGDASRKPSGNPPAREKTPAGTGGAILSLRQKLEIFESLGVSVIILIDFSQNFSTLRGRDFINTLIGRGNMRYLAVGSNFRCGFRLDTDAQAITGLTAEQGVETEVVPRVLPVSSSLIRQAIAAGDLTAAADALGRNFAVDLAGLLPVRRNRSAAFDLAGQGQILPPAGVYPAYIYMEGIKHISEVAVENGALLVPSRFGAPGGVEFLGPRGE